MQSSSSKACQPTVHLAVKQPLCTLTAAAADTADPSDFKIAALQAPSMASLVAPTSATSQHTPGEALAGIAVSCGATSSDSSFKFYDSPVFEAAQQLSGPSSPEGSIESLQRQTIKVLQHQAVPIDHAEAALSDLQAKPAFEVHRVGRQHRRDEGKSGAPADTASGWCTIAMVKHPRCTPVQMQHGRMWFCHLAGSICVCSACLLGDVQMLYGCNP